MPHLHMEYTANLPQLDTDKALLRLNHALVASGQFSDEFDIKSRAVKVESFRVGTGLGERAFVHVKLALLSGRSPEIKKQLSESLLAVLQDLAPGRPSCRSSCAWNSWISIALPTPRPPSVSDAARRQAQALGAGIPGA